MCAKNENLQMGSPIIIRDAQLLSFYDQLQTGFTASFRGSNIRGYVLSVYSTSNSKG